MQRRKCLNDPNIFCYICGRFMTTNQRQSITSFVRSVYFAYFGVKIGDQNKPWAPHKVCSVCVAELRNWSKGKTKALPFGVPMIWREPRNHLDDCYFCICKVKGFNTKNKKGMIYPDLDSARRPVPHGADVPIPKPPTDPEVLQTDSSSSSAESSEYSDWPGTDVTPQPFTQHELNDLIRDLNLPKDASELLASRLKEKNLLAKGTYVTVYRHREKVLEQYFNQEDSLVYCTDIRNLIYNLGAEYKADEWRLFIDSSKRSLKGVLLHNGNILASVPVAHSVHLKETYGNLELLLEKVNYKEHQWMICGDLKVLCMLLGQQQGYTKYPCYICEWDSRDRKNHWTTREWPRRNTLVPGSKNIIRNSLVGPDRILLPPLHIKLGLMKQFTKALDKNGSCFKYLTDKFPALSEGKVKEGIFVGPQIRKLFKDEHFEASMTPAEREAWIGFKEVVHKFLGNNKDPNYVQYVKNMLEKYEALGCNMSLKVHFLHSHLDHFPENLGAVSEEQGERFHQDIKDIERRYQGRWNTSMMADYCWLIKRDDPIREHKRKSGVRSFSSKRQRFH